ncbi:MAG: NAD-dependent DNA ligase LigA [Candidatus Omnitrophica bacterium]|nr:NAD-dependent DNA ligase LigA [Candidatus Omnitrophota bacterium]MCF7909907.1 NAD-dependent DNA ligase LigA [Candidatus Omnitrophota bacterium]
MDYKKSVPKKFKIREKTSKKEAKKEVKNLREAIEHHNYLYYIKNKPQISDAAYDRLFKRLQDLENKFPELDSADSPTKRIGQEPVDKLKKVKHKATMYSLDAALAKEDAKDLHDYIERNTKKKIKLMLEPKFDGFSVELVYKQGKFDHGSTRGNGKEGEDISNNLRTVNSVIFKLRGKDLPSLLAVRGEVFMPKSKFQKLNKKRTETGRQTFANPRNAAAGIMRQLDSKKAAEASLDVVFYEILDIRGKKIKNQKQALALFKDWGLKINEQKKEVDSFTAIKNYHQKMEEKREKLDFEIDGVVVKVNDYKLRQKLGTRQRTPRWAWAWKFAPKEEKTKVIDIVVQVGRTGMLTPVALLEPVDVGGVTISRATLHNKDEVEKKDIRKEDSVKVARAGDVIPEVVKRVGKSGKKRGKKFKMPKKCPSCGSEVKREGAYYFCPAALSCKAQLIGHLIHYGSKEALDIEGLGDKVAQELVNKNMVSELPDLYKLKPKDFKKLETFAEKSAKQLYAQIQDKKKIRLDKFLYALGIRHIGAHVAMLIGKEFNTLDKIKKAKKKDLKSISEIGPEIAESIYSFFNQKENKKVLTELKKQGVKTEPVKEKTASKILKGKKFVFTGDLDSFSREEAKEELALRGARPTSSVSSQTDYVVVGDNPGKKLKEAKKENVKIIKEEKFKKMLK